MSWRIFFIVFATIIMFYAIFKHDTFYAVIASYILLDLRLTQIERSKHE